MSMKYPFLYSYGRSNKVLIKECIESSLMDNYFVHFAGSWYESDMWQNGDIFTQKKKINEMFNYYTYLNTPVFGEPKGQIKPTIGK